MARVHIADDCELVLHAGMIYQQCVQHNADDNDIFGPAIFQVIDRRNGRSPGRQHRIDDDAGAALDLRRKSLVVGDWLLGLFIAIETDKTNARGRNELENSLEHADTRAQDWYDDQVRVDFSTRTRPSYY